MDRDMAGRDIDIEKFETFFEELGEIVYITDTATDELLFLNRAGREALGLPSPDAFKGRKCHELIRGLHERCDICTNDRLEPGKFYEWTWLNEKTGRRYALKDTLIESEGRRLRVEIAVDIDVQIEQAETLEEISTSERLINEAIELALNEDDPDEAIDVMLRHIGEQLHSNRAYIFEDNGDGTFDDTYEWTADGVVPQIDNLKRVPYEGVVEAWYAEFDKNENIVIHDIELYKEICLPIYEILKPQDIHSLVVGPLVIDGRRIGFYGIDDPPYKHIEAISTLYTVLGRFIAALLRHRDNVRKMEAFSFTDQMTGLSNRSALNTFLVRMDKGKSLGAIFCDINGLKKTNDEQGHEAGDLLIMRAVTVLRGCFNTKQVFRMGGDEFLCLCVGETEGGLAKREAELKELFKRGDVSVAVGSLWAPNGDVKFNELFRQVDAKMYADKRQHYGERRRSAQGGTGS